MLLEEIPEEPIDPDLDNPTQETVVFRKTLQVYEDIGLRGTFVRLTKKHLRDMEKELGIEEEPMRMRDPVIVGDEE